MLRREGYECCYGRGMGSRRGGGGPNSEGQTVPTLYAGGGAEGTGTTVDRTAGSDLGDGGGDGRLGIDWIGEGRGGRRGGEGEASSFRSHMGGSHEDSLSCAPGISANEAGNGGGSVGGSRGQTV